MKQFTKELARLRNIRNFIPKQFLEFKLRAINQFFRDENLDSCVVGLSGGIDSSLVFKLLIAASKEKDSPIKCVKGIFLPIHTIGITGQIEAEKRVDALIESIEPSSKVGYEKIDLTIPAKDYCYLFANKMKSWAKGQMLCILRTPALYGYAALMQEEGLKSIVVGTTNRDEGSYIGFFGKASDAMVDLQPIADMHKSEVYSISKLLKIPNEIINETPKGDVYDGKVDEEMIGAPYWFLELYLLIKDFYGYDTLMNFLGKLTLEERKFYHTSIQAIEQLHSKNKHKYKVGNPAHFIDVMKREVSGGWDSKF